MPQRNGRVAFHEVLKELIENNFFRSGADIVSLRTDPQTPHRGAAGFGARLDATDSATLADEASALAPCCPLARLPNRAAAGASARLFYPQKAYESKRCEV